MDSKEIYVEVILPLPVEGTFTYAVPDKFQKIVNTANHDEGIDSPSFKDMLICTVSSVNLEENIRSDNLNPIHIPTTHKPKDIYAVTLVFERYLPNDIPIFRNTNRIKQEILY